jgi:hypothetical protein
MTTQPLDVDSDTYLAQRPRSVAEDMGEDVIEKPAADQFGIPASAQQHAQRRKANDKEQRHSQNLAQLRADERHRGDEAAHEQAMVFISRGEDVPPALAERAMRWSRSQGQLPPTSQRLAGPTLVRLRRERQAQIEDERNRRSR